MQVIQWLPILLSFETPLVSWSFHGNVGTASHSAGSSLPVRILRKSTSPAWMSDTIVQRDEQFQFYKFEAMELASQGKLLQSAGAYRRAANLAAQSSTSQHQRSSMLFQAADLYDAMGYVPEQVSVLDLIINESNSDPLVLSTAKERLANVFVDGLGEKERALRLYRDVAEISPTATSLLRHGNVAAFEGYANESANCHVKALQLDHRIADLVLYLQVGAAALGKSTALHVSAYTDDAETLAASAMELPHFMKTSWDYVRSSSGLLPNSSWIHASTYDMLLLGLDSSQLKDGLALEFGVFHGKTIRMIANRWPDTTIHGFDTFQGIPEDWCGEPAGSYSTHGALPSAPENVRYHVGLFSLSLPAFLQEIDAPVRFMNIDCDLYSSTVDIFDALHERIVPGTILVFDEYVMHSEWQEHEFRAFQEAVKRYGWKYEYLGISFVSKQAVIRILD